MKTSLLADMYRKIGEGLGLLDPHSPAPPPVDARKVRQALDVLEALQLEWRKQGVTHKDIRAMVNEGRP